MSNTRKPNRLPVVDQTNVYQMTLQRAKGSKTKHQRDTDDDNEEKTTPTTIGHANKKQMIGDEKKQQENGTESPERPPVEFPHAATTVAVRSPASGDSTEEIHDGDDGIVEHDEKSNESKTKNEAAFKFQRVYINQDGRILSRAVALNPKDVKFGSWEKAVKPNKNIKAMYTSWLKNKIHFLSCPMEFIGLDTQGKSLYLKIADSKRYEPEGIAFLGFLRELLDKPFEGFINDPAATEENKEIQDQVVTHHTVNGDGFINASPSKNIEFVDENGYALEGFTIQDLSKRSHILFAGVYTGRRITITAASSVSKSILIIEQIKLLPEEKYAQPTDIGKKFNMFSEPDQPLAPLVKENSHNF